MNLDERLARLSPEKRRLYLAKLGKAPEPDDSLSPRLVDDHTRKLEFSVFLFGAENSQSSSLDYDQILKLGQFADRNGFRAIWTPERHFHSFGASYPNPAVLAAALAGCTTRIELRGGSVVVPLHDTLRIAEDWALVDRISNGRAALACASGWHSKDFVLAPENYKERRHIAYDAINQLRSLWKGQSVIRNGVDGQETEVRVYPRPKQEMIPIWLTSAGTVQTFRKAGELGVNVLTSLIGQSVDELGKKIQLYREVRAKNAISGPGIVTVMLHCLLSTNATDALRTARNELQNYLLSSLELGASPDHDLSARLSEASPHDVQPILDRAIDNFFADASLIGSIDSCGKVLQTLEDVGVDEIACLVDFGPPLESIIDSLRMLCELIAEL
ncbi:MupA/Atu3671 family FMN-dependent luciferase-like monooxygenase [Blastopirellula retiformator]|uniref:Alkanal monooxygenase alpha chain n=1 Tax=Blastopirellula retiformator TaxID=2527970 RepID=A0A5C5VLU3_9BACT|nr:MupA/Atu3671 family FMN-dependent luciferase-like monooxygenase [Blastopirellula retiformator]TWT38930.1 Alkanal monooxygenase alpha chain [Blastopirellula retiformator]